MKSIIRKNEKTQFHSCKDKNRNELNPENVIFTDAAGLEKLDYEKNFNEASGFYTINSNGVDPIYDKRVGNFPLALKTPTGGIAPYKLSAETAEVLPTHTGCSKSRGVIFVGGVSSGKTISVLTYTDPEFHNLICKGTSISIENDIPITPKNRQKYEDARYNFKVNRIIPPTTVENEDIDPYCFFITRQTKTGESYMHLEIMDIDGESCQKLTYESKALYYDHYIFTIGADELLFNEDERIKSFKEVAEKFITNLRIVRPEKDYTVTIMITKCDLFDGSEQYLSEVLKDNTIEYMNGRYERTTHKDGFDCKEFNKRSEAIKSYLENEHPNFLNTLMYSFKDVSLTFTMAAHIGSSPIENRIDEYKPRFIDEPFIHILANEGMYPIANEDEREDRSEKVERVTAVSELLPRWLVKLLNFLKEGERS